MIADFGLLVLALVCTVLGSEVIHQTYKARNENPRAATALTLIIGAAIAAFGWFLVGEFWS